MDNGGESNHNPIILELKGDSRKPPSLLKFNEGWLKEASYIDLIKSHKSLVDMTRGNRDVVQFLENIKRIKKDTLS